MRQFCHLARVQNTVSGITRPPAISDNSPSLDSLTSSPRDRYFDMRFSPGFKPDPYLNWTSERHKPTN
jgi:hypothetical protein